MILKILRKILSFLLLLTFSNVLVFCQNQQNKSDFPVILQKNNIECGPVCLQMIGQYYGKDIPLAKINKWAKLGESGTTALGLCEAAEEMGFECKGYKVKYDELIENFETPFIVHWNRNHFIVVYKLDKDSVFVVDPAFGKKQYNREEFCKHWLVGDTNDKKNIGGIVLSFTPNN
jgi:ATP-binding cassette subfamily B protein